MHSRSCNCDFVESLRSWSSHGAVQRSTRCQYCPVQQLITNSCVAFWHTCCTLPIHDGVCLWGDQCINFQVSTLMYLPRLSHLFLAAECLYSSVIVPGKLYWGESLPVPSLEHFTSFGKQWCVRATIGTGPPRSISLAQNIISQQVCDRTQNQPDLNHVRNRWKRIFEWDSCSWTLLGEA